MEFFILKMYRFDADGFSKPKMTHILGERQVRTTKSTALSYKFLFDYHAMNHWGPQSNVRFWVEYLERSSLMA